MNKCADLRQDLGDVGDMWKCGENIPMTLTGQEKKSGVFEIFNSPNIYLSLAKAHM